MSKWDYKKNNGTQPVGDKVMVDVKRNDKEFFVVMAGDIDWALAVSDWGVDTWRLHIEESEEVEEVENDAGAHYRCEIAGIKIDPYYIARLIGMTCQVQFTIFKKSWRLGASVKDKRQDYIDIISAAKRGIELLEDEE